MQAVIYAFRSPGSGAVYIGKHECDPEGWPRRGTGPLPDGYRGSGVAVANFHRRHGAAVQWRILATVAGGRDAVNAAERRAIRLARALLGRGCVNRLDGGDGLTPEAALRLWADPAYAVRVKDAMLRGNVRAAAQRREADPEHRVRMAAMYASSEWQTAVKEAAQRPEVRAKVSAASLRSWDDPQRRAEQSETQRQLWADPAHAAKMGDARKRRAHSPEGRAQLAALHALNARRNRARRELAPFVQTPAWLAPGAVLWAYRPPPRLALWLGRQK